MSFQQVFKQWKRTTASDVIRNKAFQSLGAPSGKGTIAINDEEVLQIVKGDLAKNEECERGRKVQDDLQYKTEFSRSEF